MSATGCDARSWRLPFSHWERLTLFYKTLRVARFPVGVHYRSGTPYNHYPEYVSGILFLSGYFLMQCEKSESRFYKVLRIVVRNPDVEVYNTDSVCKIVTKTPSLFDILKRNSGLPQNKNLVLGINESVF